MHKKYTALAAAAMLVSGLAVSSFADSASIDWSNMSQAEYEAYLVQLMESDPAAYEAMLKEQAEAEKAEKEVEKKTDKEADKTSDSGSDKTAGESTPSETAPGNNDSSSGTGEQGTGKTEDTASQEGQETPQPGQGTGESETGGSGTDESETGESETGTDESETGESETGTDESETGESETGTDESETDETESESETETETETESETESELTEEEKARLEAEKKAEEEKKKAEEEKKKAEEEKKKKEEEKKKKEEEEKKKKEEEEKKKKEEEEKRRQEEASRQSSVVSDAGLGELYLAVSGYPVSSLSENESAVYRFLRNDLGLNKAAAAGVLANIYCESNFSTIAIGDGGTSLGLCQWHAQRCRSLMGWCESAGYDYRSTEGQLHYLAAELRGGYAGVLSYLSSVPDTEEGAYQAGHYFCMYFENPDSVATRSDARGKIASNTYFAADLDRLLNSGGSSNAGSSEEEKFEIYWENSILTRIEALKQSNS